MKVLGINAFHGDSSACLLMNGELVTAVEEERFNRIKYWAGLPLNSIQHCLDSSGLNLEQIDVIAINQDSKANLWKKIGFALAKRPDIGLVLDRIKNKRERESIAQQIQNKFPEHKFNGQIISIEHHLAHLSSAFHVSSFDEAITVSVDGFGDFASGAWGVGRGVDIRVDGRVHFPHSLGIFYQALTQYLGFSHYGDEYKVMGLAPYGEPRYLDKLREILKLEEDGGYKLNLDYFRHHKEKVEYEWDNGSPKVGELYSHKLADLLGPVRNEKEELTQQHKDIARSVQAMYEEAFFHLLNKLHNKYKLDSLALAGGCAMNSVANGKIYRNTPFRKVYIQSAAGDAGGAIGAAFAAWFQLKKEAKREFVMVHAYWGPEYDNNTIGELLQTSVEELNAEKCKIELVSDSVLLCQKTAQRISEGKVVGWFQGRMEWGPRALGNRSILGDPRRADMKDILNLKIKRRESFRPFAPSILRDYVSEWFEEDDDVPFMMKVFQVRVEKRPQIPAVTHVDGSGRLQTVSKTTNPRYFRLIDTFHELTGVPVLLNTSFNENEPVVCHPREALDCFLRTRMDVLVLGDYFITRQE